MALPPPIRNKNVTNPRYSSVLAASLAAFLLAAPLSAGATALKFTLEAPASLSRITAYFAFDFIDGDLVVNNTVTVSDFDIDGTLGVASTIGGVSITDPPAGPFPVTLGDTQGNRAMWGSRTGGTTEWVGEETDPAERADAALLA